MTPNWEGESDRMIDMIARHERDGREIRREKNSREGNDGRHKRT